MSESCAVADVAEELKSESDRLLHVDPSEALRIAERILDLGSKDDAPAVGALGHLAVADALRTLGRYEAALAAYGRAAAIFQALGDDVGWARTRIGATVTWVYTGVPAEGLSEIERARQILSEHGLWLRLVRLDQHAGMLYRELGRFEEAVAAYHHALETARRLEPRDPAQEARILGNLGLAWQRLGDYERAESLHAAAVAVFAERGHAQELAHAKANSAQLLAEQGHYSRALEMATSARRTFHELARLIEAAFVGRAAVYCLLALNRFEDAVELASEVADEFERAGAAINRAGTLLLRSDGLRRLGRFDHALADLQRAETVFKASNCDGWVAVVSGERAAVLAATGAWHEAGHDAELAARDLYARGQVVSAAQATLVRASAMQALGDSGAAQVATSRALATIRGRGVPWLEYQALRLAGELALDDGETRAALTLFEDAIRALEQVQSRILTEARTEFLADKVDVYEAAVRLCVENGSDAQAFEYVERAKSRALVDALAGQLDIRVRARTPAQERLVFELTRLRRRHDQLSALSAGVLGTPTADESGPPELPSEELVACERQISALLDEIRLASAGDLERVSLLQGRNYPLELDDQSLLIEFFSAGDDLLVFVGVPPDMRATRLLGGRARAERLTNLLHLTMQTAGTVRRDEFAPALEASARKILARLYQDLLAPVSGSLVGAKRLVVVPHGILHHVPFAALHDGEQYLVQRYEVVVGPSASALAFCRQPLKHPRERVLVLAHSDQHALPGVVREAERIASLFEADTLIEEQATVAALTSGAPAADVIHLATHGLARLDAPLFSYVRLEDGQLTALDCFDLELDCALVTLSACETGWARVVAGDEQMGLPRAFLYAGAHSVLQTMWRVDDAATAHLMEEFYTHLRSGLGRGEALRAAQRELLEHTPGRSHPFFWAHAVLVGDWGPLRDAI